MEFVALLRIHLEIGKGAVGRRAGGIREHIHDGRHALAMLAREGRLLVDCRRDQSDEGVEQAALCFQQQAVLERNGGLRRERFGQRLDPRREGDDRTVIVAGVDELQDADDLVAAVLKR